jgi:hypothetical protein
MELVCARNGSINDTNAVFSDEFMYLELKTMFHQYVAIVIAFQLFS